MTIETLQSQIGALAEAMARILEHEECPAWLRERITEFIGECYNEAHKRDGFAAVAFDARRALPGYLTIIFTLDPPPRSIDDRAQAGELPAA